MPSKETINTQPKETISRIDAHKFKYRSMAAFPDALDTSSLIVLQGACTQLIQRLLEWPAGRTESRQLERWVYADSAVTQKGAPYLPHTYSPAPHSHWVRERTSNPQRHKFLSSMCWEGLSGPTTGRAIGMHRLLKRSKAQLVYCLTCRM